MKYPLILSLAISLYNIAFSQKSFEIDFCKEMRKSSPLLVFLIDKNDTICIPYLGHDKYLSPVEFYKLDIVYDKKDTTEIKLLIESNKYAYIFPIYRKDLFCYKLKICIERISLKRKAIWNYINCGAVGTGGIIQVVKKKPHGCPKRADKNEW